jgi:hypothetical protein
MHASGLNYYKKNIITNLSKKQIPVNGFTTFHAVFYTHRYAERGCGGTRKPMAAAALPALP